MSINVKGRKMSSHPILRGGTHEVASDAGMTGRSRGDQRGIGQPVARPARGLARMAPGLRRRLCLWLMSFLIIGLPGCGNANEQAENATAPPDRPIAPGSGGGITATPAIAVAPRGRVVLYTSADQEYAEQIVKAFATAYPEVEILPRYDTELTKTTGLVERLRSEASAPQADVFWSSENFLTIQLASENLLQPPPDDVIAALGDWPATFRDPEHRWFGFAGRARVVAYHPGRVREDELPQAWQDLTDPRYRNRVVMADPNFGTTRGHIATFFALWGPEAGEAYLQALRDNGVRIVRSNSQAVRELISGAADYAMTDTDDVWAVQRNGEDIRLVYPRHGDTAGQGTLLIPNTAALIAGRPGEDPAQRAAAHALLMYLLSPDVERLLYESDSHNVPIVHHEAIAIDAKYEVPDPLQIPYDEVVAVMPTAIEAANRILMR